VDIKELKATVFDVKKQLDLKYSELERVKNERRQLDYVVSLVQKQFLYDVMTGEMSDANDIEARKRLLGMDFDVNKSLCAVVNVKAQNYREFIDGGISYNKDSFYMFILNGIKDEFKGVVSYVLKHNFDKTELLSVFSDDINLTPYLENLKKSIKNAENLDIIYNINRNYGTLENIYDILKDSGGFDSYILKSETDKPHSTKLLIRKAKEYINAHCCEDVTLEDVANEVYLNPVYLSRLFKEQTGENFSDYLIGRKIKKAMEFLMDGRYKVYEISELVGYKSVQYFYRIFKQYTGMTPAEYRNREV
jgi:AraC-like DNA-binding protein